MSTAPDSGTQPASARNAPRTAAPDGPRPDRRPDNREFERYALVAALTLLVLCLLWMDRTAGAASAREPGSDALLRIELGAPTRYASYPTEAHVEAAFTAEEPGNAATEPPAGTAFGPPSTGGATSNRATVPPVHVVSETGGDEVTLVPPGEAPEALGARTSERPLGRVTTEPPAPPKQRIYVVAAGDTLSAIARKELGSTRRTKEIQRLNDLPDPNLIREGQILFLPGE